MRRRWLILIVAVVAAVILVAWNGCGGEDDDNGEDTAIEDTNADATTNAGSGGAESEFEQRLVDLEDLEATITVKTDGETIVIWSSKDNNWRWEDPNDETSYVIYRGDKDLLWIVNGDTASELPGTGSEGQLWWGKNPAAIIAVFAEVAAGDIVDDVWESSSPMGTITVELKGPEGLPSKMSIEQDGDTQVTEFEYTNVGSVPDTLFELPANVTVQQMPDLEGLEDLGAQIPEM